jgi:hypothetical protein
LDCLLAGIEREEVLAELPGDLRPAMLKAPDELKS